LGYFTLFPPNSLFVGAECILVDLVNEPSGAQLTLMFQYPGWINHLSAPLEWIAMHSAVGAHAYWIAISLSSMFSTQELYYLLMGLGYLLEPVVWASVHMIVRPATFIRPKILTLISWDLTLEIELTGSFLGFLLFHACYYERGGWRRVGSKISVLLVGIVSPVAMIAAGVSGGVCPWWEYGIFWGVGILSGTWRAAATASLFTWRIDAWEMCWTRKVHTPFTGAGMRLLLPHTTTPAKIFNVNA